MKICHVINDLSRGGAETHLLSLVEAQIRHGNEVHVLLLGRDQNHFVSLENDFVELGIKLKRLNGPKKLQGLNPFSILAASRYFGNQKFDIVHTHSPRSDFLVYTSQKIFKKINKRIVSIHGKYGTYLQGNKYVDILRKSFINKQAKIWLSADKVIVISDSIKDWLNSLNPSIKPVVIPYGISNQDQEINFTNNNIGFLGRLNKNKGIEDLVTVFNSMANEHSLENSQLTLSIGGIGADSYVKNLQRASIDKNIKFLGYVKDRYKFFESLSIFVFPSYSEGLGLVLLEAMSYGVLCIARDVAPMNKIINHEENGFLFTNNDELKKIIEAGLKLSQNDKTQIIKNARNTIENSYSIIQMYSSIEKVYSS
jgi:glycosyltransferase involved in cell wall biosynthesis